MALTKCPDCGMNISTEAVQCPSCGRPMKTSHPVAPPGPLKQCPKCKMMIPKSAYKCPHCRKTVRTSPLTMGCAIIFGIGILGMIISPFINSPTRSSSQSVTSNTVINTGTTTTSNIIDETIWQYSQTDDSMSQKPTLFAMIKSQNTVEFGFPYGGAQRATLMLRVHPRYGRDVILRIEKGQFHGDYNDKTVLIAFDSEAPRKYSYNEPADNSSESIFIEGYNTVLNKLKKANTMRIEAQFFQQGNRVFHFNVSGFDPKQLTMNKN